jgi:hypothetical protein
MVEKTTRLLWPDVKHAEQLDEFVHAYFLGSQHAYLDKIMPNLEAHPSRLQNPLYMPFVARTLLMAAEYQFPTLHLHTTRHSKRHKWKRDVMSPIHLLALNVYMAKSAHEQLLQKATILESKNDITLEQYMQVLSSWMIPGESLPPAEKFFTNVFSYRSSRFGYKKVFIPDVAFLKQVAQIPITGDQADTIQKEAFAQAVLPAVQELYFPREPRDLVSSLFLDDTATWNIHEGSPVNAVTVV